MGSMMKVFKHLCHFLKCSRTIMETESAYLDQDVILDCVHPYVVLLTRIDARHWSSTSSTSVSPTPDVQGSFLLDNRSVAAIILSEMSSDLEIPIIND